MTDESAPRGTDARLVGVGSAFEKLLDAVRLAASSDSTVLIQGETGTGKGICARAIHDGSDRASGSFVIADCARSDDLIEEDLFGHQRGAFTGATESRSGLVHLAERGTLLLDDVDLLTLVAQGKLLQFLDARAFRALGSRQPRNADIRLIATTNVDMVEAVRSKRIRKDFYHRLMVFPLMIPPLRERREDILPLARHFLDASERTRTLSQGASAKLLGYDWPGNVRELKHVIETAMIRAGKQRVITERQIELPGAELRPVATFAAAKSEFERTYVESILTAHRGNLSSAARAAELSRRTMQRLREKYEIDLDRFRNA